ncbi:MAG TPA: hypothetical protein VFU57_02250 [Candidatus Acidoferrales bacterium]|nr:hypothetical protein [Candidatus Acidoferrales bacterium]
MNWATFYLICFIVGLVFSLLSVAGSLHLPGHLHLPHFLGHHGPVTHAGHGAHVGHVVHGTHTVHAHPGSHAGALRSSSAASRAGHISFFNFSSLMAFLAWFGGTGYLLTRFAGFVTIITFALALAGGFLAAGIVFFFLAKVLLAHESELDPADFARTGVLGKLNAGIRAGGTGEIVFSQAGTRHCAGARSADGTEIPKGTEVIVTRYEKGIAYVRRYDEMAGEREVLPEVSKSTPE